MNWQDGHWLKGPETADWLERWLNEAYDLDGTAVSGGISRIRGGEAISRTLHRWRREGAAPSVWTMDKILTQHGGHLSQVPDSLWLARGPRRKQRYRHLTTEEKLELVATEGTVGELAKRFEVSERSVRGWKRGEKLGESIQYSVS